MDDQGPTADTGRQGTGDVSSDSFEISGLDKEGFTSRKVTKKDASLLF